MNPIKTILAAALLSTLPLAATAQQNIKRAMDALIQDNRAELTAHHKMDKDPETGKKEAQLDWWEFQLPKSKRQLVTDIERAFEQDREQAYSLSTGRNSRGGEGVESLAVGDGSNYGYAVGEIKGSSYIYALFLDPEDAEKIHRYAYVLEWKVLDDAVIGRLAITYATTLKHRQNRRSGTTTQRIVVNGTDISNATARSGNVLSDFGMYARMFRSAPNTAAGSIYAEELYRICRRPEASRLTKDEKKLMIDELGELVKLATDNFTKGVLANAMKMIK